MLVCGPVIKIVQVLVGGMIGDFQGTGLTRDLFLFMLRCSHVLFRGLLGVEPCVTCRIRKSVQWSGNLRLSVLLVKGLMCGHAVETR